MKKTLLISTAFFLSVASFAQTKVTNSEALKGQTGIQHNNAGTQVNSSENASSATTVHTGIVKNAKNGSSAKIKEENKAMAAEKQALAAEAKTKGQQTAEAASQGHSASASANSNAKLNASAKGNNPEGNSSINSSGNASTGQTNINTGEVKSEANQSVHATLKGANRSQVAVDKTAANSVTKIDATSKTAVRTGAASVHPVHVRPVRVKTGVQVRTVAGIGIK
ncbi:MAG: hypothetical protein KGM16_10800 [Bacteroidota bacterium]|nr:hypothetical protein [Bacteroidota bacterium]